MGRTIRVTTDTLMRQLVETMGTSIVRGSYREGAVLPNETDLAAAHGVGRSSVRETLKMLAAKGLIESRPRRGTTVLSASMWNFLDADVLRWLERSTSSGPGLVREMLCVCQAFEPLAAELAASTGTLDQHARLRQAFATFESVAGAGAEVCAADIATHAAIMEASGNRFLGSLRALVATAHSVAYRVHPGVRESGGQQIAEHHRPVIEAILARDSDAARRRMEAMLAQGAVVVPRLGTLAETSPAAA